jgi:hypothetical protein
VSYDKARAVKYAESQIGVTESPHGSNCQPYSDWQYGVRCPPGFVFGREATHGDKGFSYTESMESWARAQGLWRDASWRAQPGDWIIFDWNGDGMTDHVEVVKYDDGNRVMTIGGNTSNAVLYRTRDRRYLTGFVALSAAKQAVQPIDPNVLAYLKKLADWKNRICAPETPDGMHGALTQGMTNSNVTILNNLLLARKANIYNLATRRAVYVFKRGNDLSNTVGDVFGCEAATAMLRPQ